MRPLAGLAQLSADRVRLDRQLADRGRVGLAAVELLHLTANWPNGLPRQGELDTDRDGRVDRWEVFGTDGKLERVGTATAGAGAPQVWEHLDAAGRVTWREPAR